MDESKIKLRYIDKMYIWTLFDEHTDCRDDEEEEEPEPEDDVDLLVDDVESHDAESIVLLDRTAGTVLMEDALRHLKQKTLESILCL